MESNSDLNTTETIETKTTPVPYGLVDIDGTILNLHWKPNQNVSSLYNEALLDAYEELGIKDIVVFTNMRLDTTLPDEFNDDPDAVIPRSRYQIIHDLEERGFKVHALTMPADIGLNKGVGAAYRQFYEPQHARFVKGELSWKKQVDDIEFQEQCAAFKRAHDSGVSRPMIAEFCKKNGIDRDKLSFSFNVKGPLFAYLLESEIKNLGMALYADDEAGCRSTVELVADSRGANLITIAVDDREDFKKANYETRKAAYKNRIETALAEKAKQLAALEQEKKDFARYRLYYEAKKAILDGDDSPSLISKDELALLTDEQKIELLLNINSSMMRVTVDDQISARSKYLISRSMSMLFDDVFAVTTFDSTEDKKYFDQIKEKAANQIYMYLQEIEQSQLQQVKDDEKKKKIEVSFNKFTVINKEYKTLMEQQLVSSGLFGSSKEKEERAGKIKQLQADFLKTLKSLPYQQLQDSRVKAVFDDKEGIVYSKTSLIGGTITKEAFAALEPPEPPRP